MNKSRRLLQSGQAALVSIIFFLVSMLVVLGAFGALSFTQLKSARERVISHKVYSISESGIEDALRRLADSALTNPTIGASYNFNVSSGNASIFITQDPDGDNTTSDYAIKSNGTLAGRIRSSLLTFQTGGGNLHVGVENALHAGFLGISLDNNSEIRKKDTPGGGNVFSNGTVKADGTPKIDGNITVAGPIGNLPWHQHNNDKLNADVVICGSTCRLSVGRDTGLIDGAMSFVPNITAHILRIDFLMKKLGNINSNLTVRIFPNRRIDDSGNACAKGVTANGCKDIPKLPLILNSGQINKNDLNPENGAYDWETVILNAQSPDPLIVNEKYWIVFDTGCPASGCLSGTAGWTFAGFDDSYVSENTYYRTPEDGDDAEFYRFVDYNESNPCGGGECSNAPQDIAFKIYMGETETVLDGEPSGGKFDIVGNAWAEKIVGVDVEGYAHYQNVGAISNQEEVIAGGSLDGTKSYTSTPTTQCVDPVSTTSNLYCGCRASVSEGYSNNSYCNSTVVPNTYEPIFGNDGVFGFAKLESLWNKATTSLGCWRPGETGNSDCTLSPSGTLTIDGTTVLTTSDIDGAGTATGMINGNVVMKNSGKLLITGLNNSSQCPQNETGSNNPCYILWIRGDLSLDNSSKIKGAPEDDPTIEATIYVLVDGTVTVKNSAELVGFPHPLGKSTMFVVSYSPNVTTPVAIDLNNSSTGAVYFAFRGALRASNSVKANALSAHRIEISNDSIIEYIDGLADPFSEDGGNQSGSGTILEFHEIE